MLKAIISLFFVTPKLSLVELKVFISLDTDESCGVSSTKLCPSFYHAMPLLLCAAACIPASQALSNCITLVFLFPACTLLIINISLYTELLLVIAICRKLCLCHTKINILKNKLDVGIWSVREVAEQEIIKQSYGQMKNCSDNARLAASSWSFASSAQSWWSAASSCNTRLQGYTPVHPGISCLPLREWSIQWRWVLL